MPRPRAAPLLAPTLLPNEKDEATCTSDCESDFAGLTSCQSEFAALKQCDNSGTVTCDPSGHAEVALYDCSSTLLAWGVCSACEHFSVDTPCDSCEKTNCCSELKAMASDPDGGQALAYCIKACTDQDCVKGCYGNYPKGYATAEPYLSCRSSSCATQCQ